MAGAFSSVIEKLATAQMASTEHSVGTKASKARIMVMASAEPAREKESVRRWKAGYDLAMGRALMSEPKLILLDEPTAGLDPESARAVLNMIRELAGRGRTIVLCTHLLHEAEGVADQVVLMAAGQARIVGSQEDLAGQFVTNPAVVIDAENRSALDVLHDHCDVVEAEWNGALHVRLTHLDRLPDVVALLVESGARITRVQPDNPTLETLYFEMQRTLRETA